MIINKTKIKKILKSLILIFINTNISFSLLSCKINNPNLETNNKNKIDENNKNQPTINRNNKIEDFPIPDIKNSQEGLLNVWKYIKQIPQIVFDNNKHFKNNTSEKNDLIIKKYDQALKILGYSKDSQNNFVSTGLAKEYKEIILNNFPKETWNDLINYINNPDRLFIFEKNENEIKKEIMGIEYELIGMMGLLFLTSQKEISYIKAYIQYQKVLYSTIKDNSKTLEEQLKNNSTLKNSINSLIFTAKEFLNPISHLARNKDVIWNEHPLANYKEMYDNIIYFFNEEIAPLIIKLEYETTNPISELSLNKYVTKYFYPKINNRIKVNYSDLEINNFWNNFKLKKNFYNWKTID